MPKMKEKTFEELTWRNRFQSEMKRKMLEDHVTYKELSDRTGIGISALNNYANTDRVPPMTKTFSIALALDMDIDYVYKGVR